MDILYIIRKHPDSIAFNEAATGLLGVSLFGQRVGYLLMGDAVLAIGNENNPLAQVAEMSLAEGFICRDKATTKAKAKAPSSSPSSWAEKLKTLPSEEAKRLISSAKHVLSF